MRKFHRFKLKKMGFPVKIYMALLLLPALLLQATPGYSQLITNVTTTTGHTYTVSTLVSGATIYSDRTYQATTVPAFLNNAPAIKTPNDDKGNKATGSPTFNLAQAATVYIAYDPRATVLPTWLSGWQKLATQLGINDANISNLDLYSKTFPAGKVTLGGNLATPAAGALNMYLIMAVVQSAQYDLTVNISGSGTVSKSPNQATYAAGTGVTLTANPASGQQFTGWSGNASGTTNPLTITMDADKTVTATFAPTSSQFTVTVAASGNGTVTKSPNQANYASGASVTLTASPASGQQFTGWSGDASGSTNPLTITVNSNKSITGNFSPTAGALITNITATSGKSYLLGALTAGTTIYSDRTYKATEVPAFLNNAPFIKTSNDDKGSKVASLLSFNLTQGATVYVIYDTRATAIPDWLSTWDKLASQVVIDDPKAGGMTIYSKSFPSGNVTLGGNLASPAAGALTGYFVAALSGPSQYTVGVNIIGNGTVAKSPNQATYTGGTSVSLTATPASGLQFTGWSGDASGTANPVTVIMDANKSVTATFSSGGSGASIDATPASIYDNSVSGTTGPNRTITVSNTGQSVLSLSAINTTGTNTNQFVLSGLPAFPANITAGGSISFSIAFKPTTTGLKTATINIKSNDQANPTVTIPVRALATAGLGGANEPSLQSILNLLEIEANVGDDNIATNIIHSNTTTQKAPLLGDEISVQKFQKAGPGNVTITPLCVFGPTFVNPVLGFGWYNSGNTASKSELFTVSNSPVINGQTVNVNFSGSLSFDPASGSFGFYTRWPYFNNRFLYSEDNLNTFNGAAPHHVRVFPYKKNGIIVPNSFLVAFEEDTTKLDYQDLVFVVTNVKKFKAQTGVSNALLFVENTDGFPSNDHVVFSHIQLPWTRDSIYNANHDSVKIRLHNYGVNPLTISDLKISNNTLWKIDKFSGVNYNPALQLPATINSGGVLDLMVKFTATGTSATRVKLLHETLTISSDDDINPDKQIFLDGLWQYKGEGSREPYSHEMFSIFGFTTKSGFEHSDPDKGDSTKLKGDEIKPDYFLRADSTLPVSVRQMAAYHGCCQSKEHIKWYDKGTKISNDIFLQINVDGQTLLPRKSLNGSPAAGTFIPNGKTPFGFDVGYNYSDPNRNPGKILGVRIYKALDGLGNVIPNTYLLAGDYTGTPVTNFDYNDNVYYVSNIKPYMGSVFYSTLNVTPSAADFGENVLQVKDSMLLNLSSGGKTYPNGSQDPALVISSVAIVGENAAEFSADMPLIKTLNPQQATTLKVRFKPTSQGLKIADLLIYYNNTQSPKRVPLYGIGKAAGVTVTANYRINSGASSPTTFNGKTWAADNQYAHDNLEPFKNPAVKQVAATDEDFLYIDEQSSNGDKKPFRYQFPVANGTYYVRLHFAEIYWGVPGLGVNGGAAARVFSVKMENQYRLVNYDVISDVGAATAVIKNFPVTVTDGNLNIDFSATVNRPLVMAVEVYSFSSASPRPAAVAIIQNQPARTAIDTNEPVYNFSKPRVYPNPLRNKNLNIQFPTKYQGIYSIQLVDMLGRKFDLGKRKLNAGGSLMTVDISRFSLKPGVYFLKISSGAKKGDMLKLLIQ